MTNRLDKTYAQVWLVGMLLSLGAENASSLSIDGEPPRGVIAGHEWYFQPTVPDEGKSLTFEIRNQPSWATFWPGNGRLFGTPSVADIGWHGNIVITVSDTSRSVALPPFSIRVDPFIAKNIAPRISGTPRATVDADEWYRFEPTSYDANGHSLSYTIAKLPAWASFNEKTGALYGLPGDDDIGFYGTIRISVADGKDQAALNPFSITVGTAEADGDVGSSTPSIDGNPPTRVVAGSPYWAQFEARDADDDPLTFSIRNMPPWATFWEGNGRLFGIPEISDIGVHRQITVEVSDGMSTSALPVFSIQVDGTQVNNSAPSISGNPTLQVSPGSWFNFHPSASDPDDHALSFTIRNKPWWATFNVNTGQLYGTTGANDDRAYRDIQIRVSDGIATRTLPAFTVTVGTGGSTGSNNGGDVGDTTRSTTLSWTAPTQNVDGSALNDLSGYRIYYGTAIGSYPNSILINNPGRVSHTFQNLAPNRYYFVMTALNTLGEESTHSNVVIRNLN